MEFFDFDEASCASQAREDDVASDCLEIDESDAVANYESLLLDKESELPPDPPADASEQQEQQQRQRQLGDDTAPFLFGPGAYPMFPAKEPCDFCKRMGLDCFVAQRGVLQNGCTCCISLYRECSFTHARTPGKFLDTLHTVKEDVDIPTGGPTGKRALKSLSGATISDDLDRRSGKGAARFSREVVRILKNWLSEHSEHPYPTEQEKDELEQKTGLKRSQICNWLANARRRGKVRPPQRSSSPAPQAGIIEIPRRPLPPGADMSLMTPLERWKYSPPENEPASTKDIIRAMATTPFPPPREHPSGHVRSHSRRTGSDNDSSYTSSMFHAPSVASMETSRSSISDMSFASAFSHRSSLGSFSSMDRKERRRRRRKPSAAVNTFNEHKVRSARIFQCTFCTDSFPAKYDWQRHEKSLHLALDKWTCAPDGGVMHIHGKAFCAFCRALNPDEDHLESHNYSACHEKSVEERTFYRKDHLNQHLRLMHNVKFHAWMEDWRSTTTEIKSRCGFCNATFTTWKERVDHLAAHFRNGADMSQWQGDWGFEPWVKRLVENAMPPYLIGQERRTLDPFGSSRFNTGSPAAAPPGEPPPDGTSPTLTVPGDANCFHRLEVELTAYIRRQREAGITPTDKMLQDEARKIIYGTDDPWNQTCADNPVWLSILKRDAGLETIPNSDDIQLASLGMQPPFAADGGLRHPPVETNPVTRVLRNSGISSPGIQSPGFSSPGFQSPSFHQTGFYSAAPSMPASLAGSYVGSFLSAAPAPALSSDQGSSLSVGPFSSSAPASAPVDPFVQMGFDPGFLQHLNDSYGELDGLNLEHVNLRDDGGGGLGGEAYKGAGTVDQSVPASGVTSAPISIPNSTPASFSVPAAHPDPQQFTHSTSFGMTGFKS